MNFDMFFQAKIIFILVLVVVFGFLKHNTSISPGMLYRPAAW